MEPKERLEEVIYALRQMVEMPTPYTFTDEDAEDLENVIDELEQVSKELA